MYTGFVLKIGINTQIEASHFMEKRFYFSKFDGFSRGIGQYRFSPDRMCPVVIRNPEGNQPQFILSANVYFNFFRRLVFMARCKHWVVVLYWVSYVGYAAETDEYADRGR